MFDFLTRKVQSARRSVRWFLMVVTAQVATAVVTGVVVGYLVMFPIVLMYCSEKQPKRRSNDYEYTISFEKLKLAFDNDTPASIKPCEPYKILWYTSLAGIAVVASGLLAATIYERRRIEKEGGWALGIALGGRHVAEPTNATDRKIVNVVEEVAIAFQTTPPAVVVMDMEPAINAFAAGTNPSNTILCVTNGAIEHLKREELQALVAHECSHLVNQDTKLGTRLTAILYGLNGIHLIARWLVRDGQHVVEHHENTAGGWLSMFVGFAIWPFGLAGCWSAALLSLAFCRSREQLADAEAVDKTRNPLALASVLRKIAGHRQGGRLTNSNAPIVAPMLFVGRSLNGGWLSTHPPVTSRLMAIDPHGDHRPIHQKAVGVRIKNESSQTADVIHALLGNDVVDAAPTVSSDYSRWDAITESGGGLDVLYEAIPDPIVQMVNFQATLPLATTLLLGIDDPEVPYADTRGQLSGAFDDLTPIANFAMFAKIHDQIAAFSVAEKQSFLQMLDRTKNSFEANDWYRCGWRWLLRQALNGALNGTTNSDQNRSISQAELASSVCVVLSVVCACDGETGMSDYEFLRGWTALNLGDHLRIPADELDWDIFMAALEVLQHAPPNDQQKVMFAIATTVSGDAIVSPEESVVVQVITQWLSCESTTLAPTT